MCLAKHIRVGEEGAQARFGAKYDLSAFMLRRGEALRVGVAEDAPAQGCEGFAHA